MRFTFAIALLFAATNAIRVRQAGTDDAAEEKPERKRPTAEQKAEKFIEHMDTNKDGEVQWAEVAAVLQEHEVEAEVVAKVQEIFNTADADNNGSLTKDEIVAAIKAHMKKRRENANSEDADSRAQLADDEEPEEKRKRPTAEQMAEKFIEHMDTNEDGEVQWAEVAAVLEEHEVEAKIVAKVQKIFNDADADNNGSLTKDEIVAAIKAHIKRRRENANSEDADSRAQLADDEEPAERKRPTAEQKAEKFIEHMDTNEDGEVQWAEVAAVLEEHEVEAKVVAKIEKLFNKADADNNGSLTKDEIVAAIKAHMKKRRERAAEDADADEE